MGNPLSSIFNPDLEPTDDLDDSIEAILPKIQHLSAKLDDGFVFQDRPWQEIELLNNPAEVILHIFKAGDKKLEIRASREDDGPDYLRSINGDIEKGSWSRLENSDNVVLKLGELFELYVLEFLNDDFMILRKHGKKQAGQRRFLFLGNESTVRGLTWQQCVELLYGVHKFNPFIMIVSGILVLIIVLILIFSL